MGRAIHTRVLRSEKGCRIRVTHVHACSDCVLTRDDTDRLTYSSRFVRVIYSSHIVSIKLGTITMPQLISQCGAQVSLSSLFSFYLSSFFSLHLHLSSSLFISLDLFSLRSSPPLCCSCVCCCVCCCAFVLCVGVCCLVGWCCRVLCVVVVVIVAVVMVWRVWCGTLKTLCVLPKRLRVYIQNVPVYAGNTRTCVETNVRVVLAYKGTS